MINRIFLPTSIQQQYTCSNKNSILGGVNRINIFIGPNNSGKSRFLRSIFSQDFNYDLAERDFSTWLPMVEELHNLLSQYLTNIQMTDISSTNILGIKGKLGQIKDTLQEGGLPRELSALQELETFISELADFQYTGGESRPPQSGNPDAGKTSEEVKQMVLPFTRKINKSSFDFELPSYEKIYIPILRGLRPLHISQSNNMSSIDSGDIYKNRTIWDYFSGPTKDQSAILNSKLNIVTGLSLYNDVKRMLLGTIEQRERIRKFEIFLSDSFFEGQAIALTPHIDSDCLYVTIGKTDRPIYELGDGIQNLIILLYPIFFHDNKPLLCFIEEPEVSLHPGLQRLFVDTIMNEQFTNIQFFMTTHSNHLLDMTLDHKQISIYNFDRKEIDSSSVFSIENTQNEDIKLLDAIGVRNSSLFLSNCTVWVEGITDRLYLNKYMELLQLEEFPTTYETKRLKEDMHFSYIEYGGANLQHYEFGDEDLWDKIKAGKISSKILVIIDADDTLVNPESPRHAKIKVLKEKLGDRLLVLPCREIENTLSVKVLKSVIEAKEGKTIKFNSSLSEEDYQSCYLGDFIHENYKVDKVYRSEKGSGTISNKVSFCRTAIKEMSTVNDLSPYGKQIAEDVLKFIRSHNI